MCRGCRGAPCCRDVAAVSPVSPAARSPFGLKPCLRGWALCRQRGCSHACAKWVTATPGWQPAAPGEAAQDGSMAEQPLGVQRGGGPSADSTLQLPREPARSLPENCTMRSKSKGINNPLLPRRALLCLCTRGAPSSALPRGGQAQNPPPAPCCEPGSCFPWGQPAAPTTALSPGQALGKDGGAPRAAPQSWGKGRAHVVPGGLRGRRRWAGCWGWGELGACPASKLGPTGSCSGHRRPQKGQGAPEGKPKPERFLQLGCISGGI